MSYPLKLNEKQFGGAETTNQQGIERLHCVHISGRDLTNCDAL
jgi:hypothetical protein